MHFYATATVKHCPVIKLNSYSYQGLQAVCNKEQLQ